WLRGNTATAPTGWKHVKQAVQRTGSIDGAAVCRPACYNQPVSERRGDTHGMGEGRETTRATLRRILEGIRRMPAATPAEALAEFRRLLAVKKARGKLH